MLYELLTGQKPYDLVEYNTDEDTIKNVLEHRIAGETRNNFLLNC